MPPLLWSSISRFPQRSAPTILSGKRWAYNVLIVGEVFLVMHIFRDYIGGLSTTAGISMMPTIPGSWKSTPWILYSSLHRRGRNIKVGDVVTFTHPMFPDQRACKRVLGMPGDFVAVITPGRSGNDIEAVDTEGRWASVREQVVQVPPGHCWVSGDNLEWSRDSRMFGPLPLGLIKSKVLAVVLPRRDAKWLGSGVDIVDATGGEREKVVR